MDLPRKRGLHLVLVLGLIMTPLIIDLLVVVCWEADQFVISQDKMENWDQQYILLLSVYVITSRCFG